MSLEQVGIFYGIVLSTLGVAWHVIRWLQARPKLEITFREGGVESVRPIDGNFHEKSTLSVVIHNKSQSKIRVDSWGVGQPTKGEGPYAVFQGVTSDNGCFGLPVTLDAYEQVVIEIDPLSTLAEREPKVVYAEDWTGKKWKASRKETRMAIAKAKSVMAANAKRVPGPLARHKKPSQTNPVSDS